MGRTVIVIRTEGTMPQKEYEAMVQFFNKQLENGLIIVPLEFDMKIIEVGEKNESLANEFKRRKEEYKRTQNMKKRILTNPDTGEQHEVWVVE